MLANGGQAALFSLSGPDVGWAALERRAAAQLFPVPALSGNGAGVSHRSGTFQTVMQGIWVSAGNGTIFENGPIVGTVVEGGKLVT